MGLPVGPPSLQEVSTQDLSPTTADFRKSNGSSFFESESADDLLKERKMGIADTLTAIQPSHIQAHPHLRPRPIPSPYHQ